MNNYIEKLTETTTETGFDEAVENWAEAIRKERDAEILEELTNLIKEKGCE